jgi:hypothetical protein
MRARDISDQAGLKELCGRFDGWRRSPSKSKEVPKELWDAAVTAAERHGVHRVAKAVRVNSQRLREQVKARGTGNAAGGRALAVPKAPRVPIQLIEMGRLAEIGPEVVEEPTVVELVAADGSRLTIRTRDAGPGVLAMINAFRGRA